MWEIAQRLDLVALLDSLFPKRHQGLSCGQYLLLAALNRAIAPTSKVHLADWYRRTILTRLLFVDPALLSSQNFWNHRELITADQILEFERQMTERLIQRFQLDLRALVYGEFGVCSGCESGGFAPATPGFIALVPIPRGRDNEGRGARMRRPTSVWATESALGLLPSMALSSAPSVD